MADPRKWIAAENVARFEEKLAAESDAEKREILQQLLAEERAKARDTDVTPEPE